MSNPFFSAKWISKNKSTGSGPEADCGSCLLRRTFSLSQNPVKATLYCCGLGQAVYRINGKAVTDDVYVTHFTKYDSRVLYNIYDVTPLLSAGENAIGVHLGSWFYNDCNPHWNRNTAQWRGHPKLLLALHIAFADGSTQVLCSDPQWKALAGPAVYNNPQSGEVFDARLLPKGWDNVCCDETDWTNAFNCAAPGGTLEYVEMPPMRVIRILQPKKIEEGIYDCEESISGRAKIRVSGKAGSQIVLRYWEHRNEDGTFNDSNNQYLVRTRYQHTDTYILSGDGEETYGPEFVYHGFRYVELSGDAELLDITFEVIHNDLPVVGTFSCSDEMLNRIHDAANRSTLTNFMDMPLDCPHREQNGWTGDALISCQQSLMNFEMRDAYRKWMKDFQDAQRPSGQLPGIIPSHGWGYNWGSGPAWDSAIIQIPWQTYQVTGDDSLVRMMWENMVRYMDYMCSRENGFLVDYGLGDWKPPKGCTAVCPTVVTDTALFYANAQIMANCCAMLGEADPYTELSQKVKSAWRNAFLQDEALLKSQTFLACGIYWGLFDAEEIPEKAKALADLVKEKDYHIDCGILGTKYIFTALSENGYGDVLYRMVTNPTAPSYAYWMNLGLKNLCEQWFLVNRFDQIESLNHHMFSEVEHWFYRHVAGIHMDETGVVIKPCFLQALSWVKATHRDITVCWDKKQLTVESQRTLTVDINGKQETVGPGKHQFSLQ